MALLRVRVWERKGKKNVPRTSARGTLTHNRRGRRRRRRRVNGFLYSIETFFNEITIHTHTHTHDRHRMGTRTHKSNNIFSWLLSQTRTRPYTSSHTRCTRVPARRLWGDAIPGSPFENGSGFESRTPGFSFRIGTGPHLDVFQHGFASHRLQILNHI